ncbi:BTAD domain-containing putative transcriptional regulator [Nonomuraea angiospora]|uniref:DNA-binding SARP family transcriptional activator/tetratricopeptide (TPR) repeat protein n=1 Tax=Nonomuraea angiospora TaxID=46172 RepID=A0ABR9MFT6_9ACTN|nr:BTAD domain-containing putative transcriptional regulator [Nonomuraea angiospora]MBE1591786.1 DNA-binding SARP family transcriptional activator/tetratricopeptide (TPR) repeat protein [Nonomuraea angiospora]
MDGAEFRLLGPVGIWSGGRSLGPSTAQQRSVLAMLLLHPGRTVPLDRLVEAVWDQEPPPSARNAIQGYVSRLRRVLAGIPGVELVTSSPGYRLDLDPLRVDLYLSRHLVERARAGGQDEAGPLLRRALELWSGPPLAGVAGEWLRETFGGPLEEERLAAVEERIAADLRLGLCREPLAELPVLIGEHPLRERLAYLMMAALHQDGRRAAALEVYRDARRRLVDGLGVEPGGELQELHQRILREEPDAEPPAAPVSAGPPPAAVPAELPAAPASFTGRAEEVARVSAALAGDGPGAVRICQISGIGGVGKSSLAIHVAHALAGRYPDGQLYVDLHGASPQVVPVDPVEALGRFLRSLGVAGSAVPTDLEEAAGRFRSLTVGRRMLVILDNARDAAQVRPLLPGSPTCAVLVTSRRMLASFDGATQVSLDVLPNGDALALLGGIVGDGRIAAEPAAAAEVVRLCGGLPLALCLAAARLRARPSWQVSALAGRLASAHRRLDELRADDRGLRASFQAGYQELKSDADGIAAARMFRLLGLLDGPDLGLPTAAALAGLPEERAQRLLDLLVDARLVQERAPDRYDLHDLLRLFARERAAEEESEPARRLAVERALHHHLATARTAIEMLKPAYTWRNEVGPSSLTRPGLALETNEDLRAWVDAEEDNLLAAVGQTRGTPAAGLGVALAVTFAVPLYSTGRWRGLLALSEAALRAAEHTAEPFDEAVVLGDLGWAHVCVGNQIVGIAHMNRSLAIHRRLGNKRRAAALLDHLGIAYRGAGRFDEAADHHRQAIALMDDRYGQGAILTHLGLVYQRAGRFAEAVEAGVRSVAILEETGAALDAVTALANLAEAYRLAGDPARAVAHHREALARYRAAGHGGDYVEAESLWGLGHALSESGECDEARRLWRRAAAILHGLGLITAEERHSIENDDVPATPQVIQRML